MTDIVERLRDWQDYEPVKMFASEMLADLEEAADEIERLRAAATGSQEGEVNDEAAATTRERKDNMTPFKGELKYFVTAISDMRVIAPPAVMQAVLNIYDGERWVQLESNEGIAVVNDMIRQWMVPKAVDEVPRQ